MDNDGAIRRYAQEAQEMAADPGMRKIGHHGFVLPSAV